MPFRSMCRCADASLQFRHQFLRHLLWRTQSFPLIIKQNIAGLQVTDAAFHETDPAKQSFFTVYEGGQGDVGTVFKMDIETA
jgi:hypothetical protein